jgi:acylglycerol lipase
METNDIFLQDGTRIFVQYDLINKDLPWVFHCHGIGEHCGRHQYLQKLIDKKANLLQWDLRGHGKSSGKRAWVKSFDTYKDDIFEVYLKVQKLHSPKKIIFMGHSMGALITCGFLKKFHKDISEFAGVIINAPPVNVGGAFESVSNFLGKKGSELLFKIPLGLPVPGSVDINALSHDPNTAKEYKKDQDNCMFLHSHLLFALVKELKDVYDSALNFGKPGFVSVGTEDAVVSPKACIDYFTNIEKGFELKTIPGSYHEIHNEIDEYRLPYFEYLKNALKSFT